MSCCFGTTRDPECIRYRNNLFDTNIIIVMYDFAE